VEYLVIGGYAVNFHGHSRTTGDIHVWIRATPENVDRVTSSLRDFGFADARPELFLDPGSLVRMGRPPLRIEILTAISGITFDEAYPRRQVQNVEGVEVSFIDLEYLRRNKKASGRFKDLDDLDNLPKPADEE
jgi:hypothetical protein